jgi:hypothetical protein
MFQAETISLWSGNADFMTEMHVHLLIPPPSRLQEDTHQQIRNRTTSKWKKNDPMISWIALEADCY